MYFNNIYNNHKFIFFIILVVFASCKSTKYLNDDQFLIRDVKLNILDKKNTDNSEALEKDLTYFITQQKNKRYFWIPREYIYLKYQNSSDSSTFSKWLRKRGEVPSIYDSTLTQQSVLSMEKYLQYKKGYYNASVLSKSENKNKKSKIVYEVTLNKRYKIKSIEYFAKDTAVLNLIKKHTSGSLVKVNEGLDADRFQLEKARIVNILQNSGYADFAANYIDIKGDSTNNDYGVDIIVEIFNTSNGKNHILYKVGEINVYTDYYSKQDTFSMISIDYDNKRFYTEQSYYIIKPKVIAKAIVFNKGEISKRDDRIDTYNKLANLGVYRFAEIVPKKTAPDSNVIDYDIKLTPQIHKWTRDLGIDIFNSSLTSSEDSVVGRKFIGLGISGLLENRNLFRGSEKLSLNGAISTQIELSSKDPIRALTYGLNSNILFPTFKDPLKLLKNMRRARLLSNSLYKGLDKDATTNLTLGFNSVNFKNSYSINSINTSFGYRYTDKISKSVYFDQLRFTLNKYELDNFFIQQIDSSSYIINSFKDNLFTGIVFSNINYNVNFAKNKKGYSATLLTNLEFSGLEIMLANGLYNSISSKNDTFRLGSFEFSKFGKFEIDGRLTKHFSGKKSLTGRLNFGIVVPLVGDQNSPYVKQFNIGGPNSLRGWGIRTLGPGSNITATSNQLIPFSQGDIKIETNLEYRFNIWWILEGALFMDAGNIWSLEETDQKGGKFTPQFYNQMAVASGWGMRWDFNYFKIRFDFGYRLRDPYKTNDKYWYTWDRIKEQNIGNLQVAVNYPF